MVTIAVVLFWVLPAMGQSSVAPAITSDSSYEVDEGTTPIVTLTATDTDTDVGDLTWTKAGGADAAAFELSSSGELGFGSAKDFEVPDDADADGTYELTVQVSDGVNDVTVELSVTLANVIELADIEGPETVTFAENGWSRVATFTASSPQDRDGIDWVVGGSDAAHFSIDSPAGALRFDLDPVSPVVFSKPPDFEVPVDSGADNVYVVTVQPTTPSGSTAMPVTVTVTVSGVDEDGTVSLSTKRPRTGVAVAATLSDPDGVVDGSATWTWERTAGRNEWVVIAGADSSSFTPTAAEAGSFLRAGVTYSDSHSTNAQVQATASEVVAADQLSALSISTADSVASTGTDPWRLMRPAFDAETLHYSVGCDSTDTMTLTVSPADASSRISVDGVQYANPGAGASVTATQAVSGKSVVRIALADAEGGQTQYVVHCLPDDLGEVTVEKPLGETKVLDELILFGRSGHLLIMDSNGVPRGDGIGVGQSVVGGFIRFYPDVGGDPRYSVRDGGYRILDANFDEIDVVRAVAPLTRTDGHDFRVLEDGNYMLMAYQDTERDLSHLTFNDKAGLPYGTDVYVEDSAIQIVTPGGQATFNWNSWDHMPLEDCTQHFFPPGDGDYAHLNGMQMVDGLIIASMRGCSRVLAIDATTGDVVWRVGLSNLSDAEWAARGIGPAPLDIVGDPEGQFCGQHGVSLLPNGNLIIYDNGVQCTIDPWTRLNLLRANEEYSRALEYAIDVDNGEAVYVRAHSLHDTKSEVGYRTGNVEPLSNGHWLVSWGDARPRNSPSPRPTDTFTQVDPDTGQEWLSVDTPGARPRGTVMLPEFLVQDRPALEARFPDSSHTSVFHSGVGDAPTVVVAFNRPVSDVAASSPSLSVAGATVTSVVPHLVAGEPANAYLVTLAPAGTGAITVAAVAGKACDVGGICTADGTTLAIVPAALGISPPIAVSFGAAAYSVNEGATLEVPVELSSAHGGSQEMEVLIVGSALSASAADFSVAASVSFADGETGKTVSFAALDDAVVEGSETVELSFGALPAGLTAGSTATLTVTIADTDAAVFGFSVDSREVSEGSATAVRIAISNGVTFADDQVIDIAVTGTATIGDDFVLVDSSNRPLSAPYSVTLAAGADSVAVSLEAVDDSVAELVETVSLSATLASTSALIGSSTVTIPASDLDTPEVTITSGGSVLEGADAVFTLSRTAPVGSPLTQPLAVRVEVTATGGVLDGVAPSTVTFAAGDSTAEMRVATIDDAVVAGDATVAALVLADRANPPAYVAGSPNRATVTVGDDDIASIGVSASTARLIEGATARVTVDFGAVTFAVPQVLSVTVGGSATAGDDFVLADAGGVELTPPYELTLAAGASSTFLQVKAVADSADDDEETMSLSLWHNGSAVGSVAITLGEVNKPPTVAGGNRFRFPENDPGDVAEFAATDPEMDTITWSLDGVDAALFDITDGVLGFVAEPDFEEPADTGADNVYDVTVQASDSDSTTDVAVTVTVTDVDEAATITSSVGSFAFSHTEHDPAAVAAFTADDPEHAAIRWSLGGDDGDRFVVSEHGVLAFERLPDYEHPDDADTDNEYLVEVRARAGAGDPVTVEVTVTVTDADEDGMVRLSSAQPQVGAALSAAVTDPDGVLVVLSWAWQRSLDGATWTDIAGATSHSYTPASADDGYRLQAEAEYLDSFDFDRDIVSVRAAYTTRAAPSTNTAPDFANSPLERAAAENSTAGTAVGAPVTATDPDTGDRAKLAYTLSGTDAGLFTIDASTGQIRVGSGTVLDYEAAVRSYSVTVTATDPSASSDDVAVTIEVTGVNEPPFAAEDTAVTSEDAPVTISVLANDTDPDADTLTVTVRDAPLHGIVRAQAGDTLLYTPSDDFNGTDVFTYAASDGRLTGETTVTVTVSPVNDQPKFSSSPVRRSVAEGAPVGTPVGAPVTADDVDGDTLRYRLFDFDAELFTVNADTGQIRVAEGTVIDRSIQSSYQIRVEATDPHGARVRTPVNVTATVAVNEGPAVSGPQSLSFAENQATDRVLATYTATDPEDPRAVISRWSLSGRDAGDFTISDAGDLSFRNVPDFEAPADSGRDNVYEFSVRASDGRTYGYLEVIVTVEDVNEAPVITTTSRTEFSYRENGTATIYTFSAADPEKATVAWSPGGVDRGVFAVTVDSRGRGVLAFSSPPDSESPADSDGDNVYEVAVVATDDQGHAGTLAVTVTVADVNEGPEISGPQSLSFAENQVTDRVLASYAATDPEDPSAVISRWSLSGRDGGDFAISDAGDLSFRNVPDFERPADSGRDNVYEFSVRASDGRTYGYLEVIVTVEDVNEAPVITTTSRTEFSYRENGTATIYTFSAADPEKATVAWSPGGVDRGVFAVTVDSRGRGVLAFSSPPDSESPADSDGDNV